MMFEAVCDRILYSWLCTLWGFMDVSPLRQFAPGRFAPKTFCPSSAWVST